MNIVAALTYDNGYKLEVITVMKVENFRNAKGTFKIEL